MFRHLADDLRSIICAIFYVTVLCCKAGGCSALVCVCGQFCAHGADVARSVMQASEPSVRDDLSNERTKLHSENAET